jgi:DNA modification methylase
MNQLITGDNLEIMRSMPSESIDLIYLDPPFFSNRNYEVIWGDENEVRSFRDRWSGGMQQYISWLYERVFEMHRLLKPTGSIFLHCDWHADAYIRVQILDRLFGDNNFRNEIIWCYNGPSNVSKAFPQKHDTIFRYSKSNDFVFNKDSILLPYNLATLNRRKYAETKKKGIPFKGKEQAEYEKGKVPFDWWIDIHSGGQMSRKERIGYPTQKPEALLERIIKCASNEGDIVLDPFLGGGTTVAVADKLGRQWIGIDQSTQAIKVTELRIDAQQDLMSVPFTTQLYKYDYDTLRYKDAFEFESFIIVQNGGIPQNKKGGDHGVDGRMPDGTPIQVKRSDNVGVNVVKNFFVSAKQYNKTLFEQKANAGSAVGIIIAFSFSKGAVEEAARLRNSEKTIIELKTVGSIVQMASKPRITLEINEVEAPLPSKGETDSPHTLSARTIELRAQALTPPLGEGGLVEFYAWDFAYNEQAGFKASVIRDPQGIQRVKLGAGEHHIAVKVVDNDGLESIESRWLHLNGKVTIG